jgi:hypothetical protein
VSDEAEWQALTAKVGDRVRVEKHGEPGWKGTVIAIVRRSPVVRGDAGDVHRVPSHCVAVLTKPKIDAREECKR